MLISRSLLGWDHLNIERYARMLFPSLSIFHFDKDEMLPRPLDLKSTKPDMDTRTAVTLLELHDGRICHDEDLLGRENRNFHFEPVLVFSFSQPQSPGDDGWSRGGIVSGSDSLQCIDIADRPGWLVDNDASAQYGPKQSCHLIRGSLVGFAPDSVGPARGASGRKLVRPEVEGNGYQRRSASISEQRKGTAKSIGDFPHAHSNFLRNSVRMVTSAEISTKHTDHIGIQ